VGADVGAAVGAGVCVAPMSGNNKLLPKSVVQIAVSRLTRAPLTARRSAVRRTASVPPWDEVVGLDMLILLFDLLTGAVCLSLP
jgi:hypothetical protein